VQYVGMEGEANVVKRVKNGNTQNG